MEMSALLNGLSIRLLLLLLCCLSGLKSSAQIRINEFLAFNASIIYDPDFGEYSDFIELYNAADTAVNMKGYFITDKTNNDSRWQFPEMAFPAKSYLLIWADGRNKIIGDTAYSEFQSKSITVSQLHTNFSLSGDGEYIAVYDAQKKLLDEVQFGVQVYDIARGRNPSDTAQWWFSGDVTPGFANSIYGSLGLDYAPEPEFSLPAGFYPAQQNLNISSDIPGAEIRFTFDGTIPNLSSALVAGDFNVIRTYTIKARVYVQGMLPSKVVTQTYFIGESFDLPVFSISTDNKNINDNTFGIFRNAIKDREVPAVIEFFSKEKQLQFQTPMGLRIFGSTIYNLPQKPLSVRFNARYGDAPLEYPLFENRENEVYQSFQLRNGGNDYNVAYFRDGLSVALIRGKMDIDYQEYQPCIVMLNGVFHGIYEMRERLDEFYIGANYGVHPGNVDMLEDSLVVDKGSAEKYTELLELIKSIDLSNDKSLDTIALKMDVNEYINYIIHRVFVGYKIVDFNNRYWRYQDENARWRWIAVDQEHSFGKIAGDGFADNTIEKIDGSTGQLPEWSTELLGLLLKNKPFQDEFIQRFAVYLSTIYQPSVTTQLADSFRALMSNAMNRHILRWNTPSSFNQWNIEVNFIKTFLQNRPAAIRGHLKNHFNVQDSALVKLTCQGEGNIEASGVVLNDSIFSTHFFKGAKLRLKAIPKAGYTFIRWEGITGNSPEIWVDLNSDSSFTAVFQQQNISIIPPLIDKDTTLSAALSPWYALEDIQIKAGAVLTVEPGVQIYVSDKASFYVHGGMFCLGEENNRIQIQPNPEAWARNPVFNKIPKWGVIVAENATDSLIIRHTLIEGTTYGKNRSKQFSAVTSLQSHVKLVFAEIRDNMQPFYSEGGSVYIGYSTLRCENTCDLINVKYCTNAITEYCDLQGNRAYDTDAIDYDEVVGVGIIRGNKIYGFLGENSDGIDLGEEAKNLIIEDNLIMNCTDKGISVGQASTILVRRNVIADCNLGVAVKDSFSFALIDQNTFYGNNYTIACYEKNAMDGGGVAEVKNSILAESLLGTFFIDNTSSAIVTYSLSDRELMVGEGNIFDNPLFVHPATGNFELYNNSPCINSGDPNSPKDPDSSRADMGAYYRHLGLSGLTVHINEFNYKSAENYNTGDWLELYNKQTDTVDISHWRIAQGAYSFTIPDGTLMPPGTYFTIAHRPEAVKKYFSDITILNAKIPFELNDVNGKISLYDADGQLRHSVRYAATQPWPPLAAGKGATVELDHGKEGNKTSDWRESYVLMGTPSALNSFPREVENLFINEVMASNTNTITDENGDYDDWIEIYNAGSDTLDLRGLYITDNTDVPLKWQVPLNYPEKTKIAPGAFLLIWADEQMQQGPLHADFKLNIAGEKTGIFNRVGESYISLDELTFDSIIENESFGRYPDASAVLSKMYPTPSRTNVLTLLNDTPRNSFLKVYPNPFSSFLIMDVKDLRTPYTLNMMDLSGKTIWSQTYQSAEHRILFNGFIPMKGLYILMLTDATGQTYIAKVISE